MRDRETDDSGARERRPDDRRSVSTIIPHVPREHHDAPPAADANDTAPARPRTRRPRRAPRPDGGATVAPPGPVHEAVDEERRAYERPPRRNDLASPTSQAVYRRVMATLHDGGVRFLVGGAYAFTPFTGIPRSTKDFDLFVAKAEIRRALDVLAAAGFRTELTFPHWLGKAYWGHDFVDLIFSSGNGVAPVDERWFDHAPTGKVLGVEVRIAPAEEMLWSKAFVMERERWRVLLSYLVLFGFVYPGERSRIPPWVMELLLERLHNELTNDAPVGRLCQGTVLSRQQYLPDVLEWGYADGRLAPNGEMSAHEIADWTAAIGTKK
jgi:hypothetical protein